MRRTKKEMISKRNHIKVQYPTCTRIYWRQMKTMELRNYRHWYMREWLRTRETTNIKRKSFGSPGVATIAGTFKTKKELLKLIRQRRREIRYILDEKNSLKSWLCRASLKMEDQVDVAFYERAKISITGYTFW